MRPPHTGQVPLRCGLAVEPGLALQFSDSNEPNIPAPESLRARCGYRRLDCVKDFDPHPLLRNPHLMTIASSFWRRNFPRLPRATDRLFEVERETRILAHCHWLASPQDHPTLLLVHGLEGSSDSGYMLGTAEKAFTRGFNVLRVNQRNCGGTEQLTSTLYNSGLSRDFKAVVEELIAKDGLPEIFAAGYSMGGNLVLKMAGEWSDAAPAELRAIVAISPSLDLAACARALNRPQNWIYQRHFVNKLKQRMRLKAKLFPGLYPLDGTWPRAQRLGFRRRDHRAVLRFSRCRRLLRAFQRASRDCGDSRSHVDRHRAGRSDDSVPAVSRSGSAIESPNYAGGSAPWRALRIHLAAKWLRTLLERGAHCGILPGAFGAGNRE